MRFFIVLSSLESKLNLTIVSLSTLISFLNNSLDLFRSFISFFYFSESSVFTFRTSSTSLSSFLQLSANCFDGSSVFSFLSSYSSYLSSSSTLSSTLSICNLSWCSILMCFRMSYSNCLMMSSYILGGPSILVKCDLLEVN